MGELVRENIFLDQCVGTESSQILLEGDIIVPDARPDMALLLQTDATVAVDTTEIGPDRVHIAGRLTIELLYTAKGEGTPVHAIRHVQSIDDFINLDGITSDMWVRTKADVAHVEYKMVNDRKVYYRAIVNVRLVAERSDAHEMVVHIHDVPENQLLKNTLGINRTIEHRVERFAVRDVIQLAPSRPNIREVLQFTARVANKDVRLSTGRVTISGELMVTALYRGDGDESLIEFIETELPFHTAVDISGAHDDMFVDDLLQVLEHHVVIRPDADGEDRVLEVEISFGAQLKVYSMEMLPILEDAYCINQQLTLTKATVRYPRLVCRNRNQVPVKEVLQLSTALPDMLQIHRVKGRAQLDEVKVIEDKVIVEGAIDADILYLAESDAQPLASFKGMIPYRQVIEAKGAGPSMRVNVDVSVDHVAFSMLSSREAEVRFLLTFNTQVVEEEEARIITDISFAEMDATALSAMASMTVYMVQPGDTLWKIAKRYNTSVDDLLAVNDMEGAARLMAGQKLLVLKKSG